MCTHLSWSIKERESTEWAVQPCHIPAQAGASILYSYSEKFCKIYKIWVVSILVCNVKSSAA